jgi:hypothetical protein
MLGMPNECQKRIDKSFVQEEGDNERAQGRAHAHGRGWWQSGRYMIIT